MMLVELDPVLRAALAALLIAICIATLPRA